MSKRTIEFEKYSKSSKHRAWTAITKESSSEDGIESSHDLFHDEESIQSLEQNETDSEGPEEIHDNSDRMEFDGHIDIAMGDEEHNDNSDDNLEYAINSDETDSEETESDTESEEDNLENEDESNRPVYPGAVITVAQSILSILVFSLRHKISGSCLTDLLALLSMHCPSPNHCCKTLYRFKQFFANVKSPIIRHFYCSACFAKLLSTNSPCNRCPGNTATSYFIEIPIIDQIRKLFKRPGFYRNLDYRFNRQKKFADNLEDIYDGEIYKKLIDHGFLANASNISLTWNTDGIALFKSSKFNIWPFYFVINELPYKKRVNRENLILAGIWFGEKKPEANLFTDTFREPLLNLYRGLDFEVPDMEIHVRVKGIVMCGTCDSPAKALFLCMQQYNGTFGCPKCTIRSIRHDNVQVYPYVDPLNLRTSNASSISAREAFEGQHIVEGVKGPSVISQICYDYIATTSIDVMHCVYLGVVKKLMMLWFDVTYAGCVFSLSRFRNLVDSRISVAPPAMIQRILRRISDYAYWKASEFKIWFLYYSLPILKDIMEPEYFDHQKLLVFAITTLNQPSISIEMIDNASRALKQYVKRFEKLYGLRHMTSNIHLLLHLPDVVKKFGPLWVTSCFPFEDANGMLKSLVHGTRYAPLQICSSVSIFINLDQLKSKFLIPQSDLETFCDRLSKLSKRRRKTSRITDALFIIGKLEQIVHPTDIILVTLARSGIPIRNIMHSFTRILKDGIFYNSESYTRLRKYNSSFATFDLGGVRNIGIIHSFVKLSDCVCNSICRKCDNNSAFYAIMIPLDGVNTFASSLSSTMINSIFLCHRPRDEYMIAISVYKLKHVCFHTEINHELYVVEPVNEMEFE